MKDLKPSLGWHYNPGFGKKILTCGRAIVTIPACVASLLTIDPIWEVTL